MRRIGFALLKVSVGLTLGLVLAELAFWWRDDGAFPHVNLYLSDAELGTRLHPGSSQRLAFTGNPATTVRVNDRGFRGEAWPPHGAGELVMVGDSQVFGLGVEEDQTIAAQLAKQTGRVVLNAGVPTYGPREYLAVARRVLKERPGGEVLLVFNVANDFFELERPNRTRHAVWDGWAVRKENHPGAVEDFPGRQWLFSKSHLVFALRVLQLERLNRRGDSESLIAFDGARDRGTPSEGSWGDLLTAHERLEQDAAEARLKRKAEAEALERRAEPLREEILEVRQRREAFEEDPSLDELSRLSGEAVPEPFRGRQVVLVDRVLAAQVGDVVRDTGSEMARAIPVTAELLQQAAVAKQIAVSQRREAARALERQLRQSEGKARELEALRWQLPSLERVPVPGDSFLDELAAFQAEVAPVTLVVLPLDVQVSAREWDKYQARPIDLDATVALNTAFTRAAEARGLRAVHVLPELMKAEPGAFLLGDLHLTPKGTGAAARAIAERLSRERPVVRRPGLPAGVTPLPSPLEWLDVGERTVKGSSAARCETKQVREWLRVRCRHTAVRLARGRASDLQLLSSPNGASAVVPVRPGSDVELEFQERAGDGPVHALVVRWPEGAAGPSFEMTRRAAPGGYDFRPEISWNLLHCFTSYAGRDAIPWGEPQDACADLKECAFELACMQGHPDAPPPCGANEVNAGPDHRCARRCVRDDECRGGRCEDWQGVKACR